MEPGDFIVHVDFGIGKFGGLVRVPTGDSYKEAIRIIYQHGEKRKDKLSLPIHICSMSLKPVSYMKTLPTSSKLHRL